MSALWHNHAHLPSLEAHRLRVVRGEGAYVYDDKGRQFLDVPAGLWYSNVGHGRTEIADAIVEQLARIESYPIFGYVANVPAEALADRLASIVPVEDATVFFTSGGSDSVDTVVKLVRSYWHALSRPSRKWMISRTGGYHGLHGYGTSICGVESYRIGVGDLAPECTRVAATDPSDLERTIQLLGEENVAAFICEPILGGGSGVVLPPDGYLSEVQRICERHGVMFIVDEVITGFGRTGSMFASERYGLRPDAILMAKGLTSGYLPLGAVAVGKRLAEPFWRQDRTHVFTHGLTYSGHATSCAAAMANIDIIERDSLVARVKALESPLHTALQRLASHEQVAEVRGGVGLLGAVAFNDEHTAEAVALAGRQFGLLLRVTGGNALQISPPFVISEEEVVALPDRILAAIDDSLERSA